MQSIPSSIQSPLTPLDGGDAVELTVYIGASRPGIGSALYDELEHAYCDRGLRISHRFTAAESFGRSRHPRHDTSADLSPPVAVVAVDDGPTITSALGAASPLVPDTLVTLAPTAIVRHTPQTPEIGSSQPAQLVIHCRRGHGRDDPQGVRGVLETLRRNGIAGATALGRGEGTIGGTRHSPHLFSPAAEGPMMVVSIDHADVFARAAPSLLALPQVELITATPIALCKWRGHRTPAPAPAPDAPPWSRITLYTGGETPLAWRPAHLELVERLHKLGAPGVTALRGTIGYSLGDPRRPHQRWYRHTRTPMMTTIIDTPDHADQWLRAIDEVTHSDGLVTHEFVSAHRLM